MARRRVHHRQPPVPRRQTPAHPVGRRVRRCHVPMLQGPRTSRGRHSLLLVRKRPRDVGEWSDKALWPARNSGYSGRSQPTCVAAHQGVRRHLLGLVRPSLVTGGRSRSRLHRRIRRWCRVRTRALDGQSVESINANLSTGPDLTAAQSPERANVGIKHFMGEYKGRCIRHL